MYFAIEGVIGVGKTTTARLLQPFDAEIFWKSLKKPFLSNFTAIVSVALFKHRFFLMSRYHQQNKVIPSAWLPENSYLRLHL